MSEPHHDSAKRNAYIEAVRHRSPAEMAEPSIITEQAAATAKFLDTHATEPRAYLIATTRHSETPQETSGRPPMTAAEFRAALKHLRVTQRSLAERLGVEPTTVNRWATGKAPVPPYVDYVLKLIAQLDEHRR